jgi:hypothetical protein
VLGKQGPCLGGELGKLQDLAPIAGALKPICYLRMRDGKPDWAEDCVSGDDHSLRGTYPADEGYSVVPLYAHPPKLRDVFRQYSSQAEVRLNDDGTLDEVCGQGVDAHLEQMDAGHWFLTIGDVAVWLFSKRKITTTYERREPLEKRARDTFEKHVGPTEPLSPYTAQEMPCIHRTGCVHPETCNADGHCTSRQPPLGVGNGQP